MSPLRIALIYALAGVAWIVSSDVYLYGFSRLQVGNSSKGIAFVLITAGLIHFLTARLQAQLQAQTQEARRSEAQFRRAVESSPVGTFVETGGVIRYLNPAAIGEFGASSSAQLLGTPAIDRLASHPVTASPFPQTYLRADGQPFEVEVSTVPIVYDGDAGSLVFFRNVTELRNRERWFQLLADGIPAMVWVGGKDGEIIYVNARWREFTGCDNAGTAQVFEAVHPEDVARVHDAWYGAMATGASFEARFRYRRSDGQYRWQAARALPLRELSGAVANWFGVAVDTDDSMRFRLRTEQAVERERARIARDLHDDLGQLLAVTKMGIEAAPASPELASAAEAISAAMVRTRDMAVLLHPPVIDKLGLYGTLQWQAAEFQRSTGIACDAYVPDGREEPHLSPEGRVAAYRIVQEALHNVARHARATEVAIEAEHDDSLVQIVIRDNGIGFDPETSTNSGRLGIIGMHERALLANGSVDVVSAPGKGSVIRLAFRAGFCAVSESSYIRQP